MQRANAEGKCRHPFRQKNENNAEERMQTPHSEMNVDTRLLAARSWTTPLPEGDDRRVPTETDSTDRHSASQGKMFGLDRFRHRR